jgi:magnesium-transporting ATPase (P-type)
MTIARLDLPTAGAVDVEGKGYVPVGGLRQNGGTVSAAAQAEALDLARAGVLCNEASLTVDGARVVHVGDTVDVAFLVLGEKLGLRRPAEPHLHQLAFEAHRKYAATVHLSGGAPYVAVKGAAEVVLPMCHGQDVTARLAQAHALAAQGYRVMVVAGAPWPHATLTHDQLRGLNFLGFVCLLDPLRPDVPEALARCRAAGVAVRMVTGDHPATALAISRAMGLAHADTDVLTGADMTRLAPNPMALDSAIRAAKVYARVDPAQKLQIVKAMQRAGHIVAVTGDGVNDAPALHAAHIGVAMGKAGTDVAREAADLILTDDNFSRIVHGIEQGRIAYANVRKVVYFLLSTGMASVVMFVVALAAGAPLPLFAPQLLWLNLVANGLQDVGLSFEKGEPGLLNQPPRPPAQPLLNRSLALEVGLTGSLMGLLGAGMFLFWLGTGVPEAEARNLLLLLLISLGNMQALNVRSEKQSVFRVPLSANWFLVLAVVGSQLVHMAAMHTPGLSDVLGLTPISLGEWAEVVGLAALLLAVSEVYKAVWRYAATWAIRSRDDTSASGDRP